VEFFRTVELSFIHLLGGVLREHAAKQGADALSPPQAAVVAWAAACADVPNGGLGQFFYNLRGDFGVVAAADLLEQLSLPKPADALRQAHDVYLARRSMFDVENPFERLFGKIPEFKKLEKTVSDWIIRGSHAIESWARQNISQLVLGDDGKPIDPQMGWNTALRTHRRGGRRPQDDIAFGESIPPIASPAVGRA
jgi:hypothetical protein